MKIMCVLIDIRLTITCNIKVTEYFVGKETSQQSGHICNMVMYVKEYDIQQFPPNSHSCLKIDEPGNLM